jgi:hypothetical protein
MRKEFPLEDQTRIDKDDAMFGRGPLPAAANVGEVETPMAADQPTFPASGTPGVEGSKQDWPSETTKL